MHQITGMLDHYGYIILFLGLLLELIALPTPGELLMSYCGFLVYQNKLNWAASILISSAGAIIGITISYFLGRFLGEPFFRKYGSKIHMGPERIEKVSGWFEKYGNKLLIVAFFITGVRHITGYFSGITGIPYKKFALNAYLGALLWTSTFISLGRTLGSKWDSFHGPSKKYLIIGGLAVAVVLIVYYVYKNHRTAVIHFIMKLLEGILGTYHSFGRLKVAVACIAIAFMGFLILIAGLIQDYMAKEFNQFDTITSFIVHTLFTDDWSGFMNFFMFIASTGALVALTAMMLIWIKVKGKDKWLEVRFLFITMIAGQLLQEGLGLAFHRSGPVASYLIGKTEYTFPSEQVFMTVVAFGFAAFLLLRHTHIVWLKPLVMFTVLTICLFTGISKVFFQTQYPSDIAAGYAFGGAWLSLNIILLEVFRNFPGVQTAKARKTGHTQ